MKYFYIRASGLVKLAFILVVLSSAVLSQNNSKLKTATTRLANSTIALKSISALPSDQSIPAELIAKAKVIAIFPNITKINLLFQKAMKGSGLAVRRTEESWATPVFYQFGMVDKGWTTVESKSPSVVMLFMDDVDFKNDHLDISNTVAGPIGGSLTDADKKRLQNVRIIAYGLADDKLIGIKIEESDTTTSSMGIDNAMNKSVFGKKGNEIFWSNTPPANMFAEFKDLQAALSLLAKSK